MTDTKECPNCGKWMIKWEYYKPNEAGTGGYPENKWHCSCGHSQKIIENNHKFKTFEEAWQEANKAEE